MNFLCTSPGKTETFSMTVTDKFLQLQPIMQNITRNLHDLTHNATTQEKGNQETVDKLEKMIQAMDLMHKQATIEMKNDFNQKLKDNLDECKRESQNLEKKVIMNLETMESKESQVRNETEEVMSNLSSNLKSLTRRVDKDQDSIETLKNFQNDVRNNLDLIKGEINRSVDVLTKAMERNVTSSIDVVKREVCNVFC